MTPEQFCYWLQGFLELGEQQSMSREQMIMLKDHLSFVFNKVTKTKDEISAGVKFAGKLSYEEIHQMSDEDLDFTHLAIKLKYPNTSDEMSKEDIIICQFVVKEKLLRENLKKSPLKIPFKQDFARRNSYGHNGRIC